MQGQSVWRRLGASRALRLHNLGPLPHVAHPRAAPDWLARWRLAVRSIFRLNINARMEGRGVGGGDRQAAVAARARSQCATVREWKGNIGMTVGRRGLMDAPETGQKVCGGCSGRQGARSNAAWLAVGSVPGEGTPAVRAPRASQSLHASLLVGGGPLLACLVFYQAGRPGCLVVDDLSLRACCLLMWCCVGRWLRAAVGQPRAARLDCGAATQAARRRGSRLFPGHFLRPCV